MAKYQTNLDIPASLLDIVDLDQTTGKELFYIYKDKKTIGIRIFKELLKRYNFNPKNKKANGFSMNEGDREVGILSQSQSLQSLLLLTSSFALGFDTRYLRSEEMGFDVNADDYSGEVTTKKDLTIRYIMDEVIEDILERLQAPAVGADGKKYIFGASPYVTDAFTTKYAYIDCVTWVISTFLLVLRHHVDIGEICKYEPELIDVIKSGLDYLNEAYIVPGPGASLNKLGHGWNFTRDCEEPSLYFTFTVAECYVDLFTNFQEYLTVEDAVQDQTLYGLPIEEKLQQQLEQGLQKRAKVIGNSDLAECVKSIVYEGGAKAFFGSKSRPDVYNELWRLYMAINDYDTSENCRFRTLEKNCKAVGQRVWDLTREKFADYFFFNDLHATITEDDIRMSTTNDALFNTVYIINILIDSGLDENIAKRASIAAMCASQLAELEADLADEAKAEYEKELLIQQRDQLIAAHPNAEKEAQELEREYNNLLDTCQFALQKALRVYENLKSESREYIVDQFLVGFNEKLEKLEDMVRELRKLRIRVFSLVPLFIKTNSIISEYLVKYPQNSMKRYLGYIMDNRYIDKKQGRKVTACWIWEQDGYFSASNYYYISALGEFYAYYEIYEQKYIDSARDECVREDFLKELQKEDGTIGILSAQVAAEQAAKEQLALEKSEELERLRQEKDRQIQDLRQQLAEIDTPVEDAVKEVIARELRSTMPMVLGEFMSEAAKNFHAQAAIGGKPDGQYLKFRQALGDILLSFFAQSIADNVDHYVYSDEYENANEHTKDEKHQQLIQDIRKDFSKAARHYIHDISGAIDEDKTSHLRDLLNDSH